MTREEMREEESKLIGKTYDQLCYEQSQEEPESPDPDKSVLEEENER